MNAYPRVERFESASVVLPVLNETASLAKTVEIILADARRHVRELLIVVCPKTTPEATASVNQLQAELPDLVVVVQQRLPYLGGAYRDAFAVARGSHVLMMGSDLETDPGDVKTLIAASIETPWAVVTASRWRPGGGFFGYSRTKLVCNWIFQRCLAALYGVRLSDLTFGFRILPTRLAQAIAWQELRHPFNLETLVKPLRLGVPVIEIPSVWRARNEGGGSSGFFRNFAYFRTGLAARFASRQRLLKGTA